MQNITSTSELNNAIQLLEIEHTKNEQQLKNKIHFLREHFKPANILKNSLKNTISSPDLINDIISPAIVLATGYLTKKIVVGSSDNKGRKILGSALQYGITSFVAQHPDAIKSMGRFIVQHIFSTKKNAHLHEQTESQYSEKPLA